jgi:hypothetical protein
MADVVLLKKIAEKLASYDMDKAAAGLTEMVTAPGKAVLEGLANTRGGRFAELMAKFKNTPAHKIQAMASKGVNMVNAENAAKGLQALKIGK